MTTQQQGGISESELKDKLQMLLQGHPAKVWLVSSDGVSLDVRFSIGGDQGETPKLVDFSGGFYLMGEGVSFELLRPMHNLFEQFCQSHEAVPYHARQEPILVHYRASPSHQSYSRHHVSMHYPVSFGSLHPPFH